MVTNPNPELPAMCVCDVQHSARFACRLNNVFMYCVATEVSSQNSIRATYGSLLLTFSPPVNGFSFLVRNLNAQAYSNRSKITVTTATGNVTHSVPFQENGDINFVSWFQNDSSITSVALSPLTFKFSGIEYYTMAIALDELRVYTRNTTEEPISTTPSDTAIIWIWSGAGSFFLIAIATVYLCRRRYAKSDVKYTGVEHAPSAPERQ